MNETIKIEVTYLEYVYVHQAVKDITRVNTDLLKKHPNNRALILAIEYGKSILFKMESEHDRLLALAHKAYPKRFG